MIFIPQIVDQYHSCDQVTAQDLQMQVDSKVKESVPKHYLESVDFLSVQHDSVLAHF